MKYCETTSSIPTLQGPLLETQLLEVPPVLKHSEVIWHQELKEKQKKG